MIDVNSNYFVYNCVLAPNDENFKKEFGPFLASDPNKMIAQILKESIPLLLHHSKTLMNALRFLEFSDTPLSGNGIKFKMWSEFNMGNTYDPDEDPTRFLYDGLNRLDIDQSRLILEWMMVVESLLEIDYYMVSLHPLKQSIDQGLVDQEVGNIIPELRTVKNEAGCHACNVSLDMFGYCNNKDCFHHNWQQDVSVSLSKLLLKDNADFIFKKRPKITLHMHSLEGSPADFKSVDHDLYDYIIDNDLECIIEDLVETFAQYNTRSFDETPVYEDIIAYVTGLYGDEIGTKNHHYSLKVSQLDLERFMRNHLGDHYLFEPTYI